MLILPQRTLGLPESIIENWVWYLWIFHSHCYWDLQWQVTYQLAGATRTIPKLVNPQNGDFNHKQRKHRNIPQPIKAETFNSQKQVVETGEKIHRELLSLLHSSPLSQYALHFQPYRPTLWCGIAVGKSETTNSKPHWSYQKGLPLVWVKKFTPWRLAAAPTPWTVFRPGKVHQFFRDFKSQLAFSVRWYNLWETMVIYAWYSRNIYIYTQIINI